MSAEHSCYVGLDVGGTSIKSLLVDSEGVQIGQYGEVESRVKEGYRATFGQLSRALEEICSVNGVKVEDVAGIGLDVPAPSSHGVIWGVANLAQDWVGTDIRSGYERECGKPVVMTNDANAAAVGEYMMREGYHGPLLLLAAGTGLGGGFVLPGGELYEGANGLAFELGRITVPFQEDGVLPADSTGTEGALEAWVSLMALRRQVERELAKPENSAHVLNQGSLGAAEKAYRLRDLAEQGDAFALHIFEKQAHVLGYAVGDLCATLDPGLVVIGGGLAEAQFRDWYLDCVREGFAGRAQPFYQRSPLDPTMETTRFEWALGGDGAAAYGMARMAQRRGTLAAATSSGR
jgi:predicted NBD/HSP70 family sugar kinase